jgi:hypothetical protein
MTVNKTDLDYYRMRLLAEESAVRQATHPQAVRCHRSMADHYARLIAAGVEEQGEPVTADHQVG